MKNQEQIQELEKMIETKEEAAREYERMADNYSRNSKKGLDLCNMAADAMDKAVELRRELVALKATAPVEKKERFNVLSKALNGFNEITSEQAADILRLEGKYRKQAAVVTLTQLEKAGLVYKRNIGGLVTYVIN